MQLWKATKRKNKFVRRTKNGIWFSTFGAARVGTCYWCGRPLTFAEATLDHDPPLSMPGSAWKKAVIACKPCNQQRGEENAALLREIEAAYLEFVYDRSELR